jgi:hypothetical protein
LVPVQGQHQSIYSYDAQEPVFSSVCLKFSTGLEEKLVAFQQRMTGLQKMNCYILSKLANGEEAPLCFDIPSNDIVNYMRTHPVVGTVVV